MEKLSKMIRTQRNREPYFPMVGRNGYAGEQDGSHVCLSDVYSVSKVYDADRLFPDGVPPHVRVHWSEYKPGQGWTFTLGCWSDQCPDNWDWPSA